MKNFTIFCFIVLCSLCEIAQSQVAISRPNLGFNNACAGNNFNTYDVTITFTGESSLGSSNRFFIELSDPTGSFSAPETVFISEPGEITSSPATLTFQMPEDAAGENYRVRVRTTSPASTSSSSNNFAGYFRIQDSPFTINGLEENAVFCAGGSFLLTIDNPGEAPNISPLQFPSLTYRWFIETSETTSEFVSEGNSLSVTVPGVYFVETNYGSCSATSRSFSNRVTVTQVESGEDLATIESSLGNPYCAADGPTILSTTMAESYQWFRDGEAILGATNQTLETNDSGLFSVSIELQGCTASASIDLVTTSFTASIDIDTENPVALGTDDELLVSLTLENAIAPEFEWTLNGNSIQDATENSFLVTQGGEYTVTITETEECLASEIFTFTVTEPFPDVPRIPNVVTPNGDANNQNWVIPREFVNTPDTRVMIISMQGEVVLDTTNYQNTWPTDSNNLPNVTSVYYYIIRKQNQTPLKGSITVVK